MTKIHLVGSNGFIGKAIRRLDATHEIQCWSHKGTTTESYFDLLDNASWDALLNSNPTNVILLSWPGLPNYDEAFHITRNLPAVIELIEKLRAAGMKRIVVAGTCYEYGMMNGELSEELPSNPVNNYAIAKDSLRRYIDRTYRDEDLRWCWVRIFYPYGVGQNPKSLLPSLINAIKSGKKEFPMGSGRQIRDFIDVGEVAQHLLTLVVHSEASGIYNSGSGVPQSVFEIAEKTVEALGSDIQLVRGALADRSDEPLAFWAQTLKIQTLQNNLP